MENNLNKDSTKLKVKIMGMSKYDELTTQILNYLDNEDWYSAYSLLKNKVLKGDAAAYAILGEFYIEGIGVPKDVEMGVEFLKKAVNAGCADATNSLAVLYLQGEKVPVNERLAIDYIRQGADMGDAAAMGKMATVYLYGDYGIQDNRIALEWAQKSSILGDLRGMECLSVIYDDGIGVCRDPIQAAYWYREVLSRDQENTFCMYRLAVCLADPFEDFNLHPDDLMLEEAYSWARKGVEKGNLDCHMLVAWFYEMGNIVNQDYGKAYKYFKIAADNGHEMSSELIKRYRRDIFGNYTLRS